VEIRSDSPRCRWMVNPRPGQRVFAVAALLKTGRVLSVDAERRQNVPSLIRNLKFSQVFLGRDRWLAIDQAGRQFTADICCQAAIFASSIPAKVCACTQLSATTVR
jgi:hypothetical protein